jgi:3-dehydroquinate synthase
MDIFLYGPPGTGKSTIGRVLARDLDLPFVDLDRLIESNAGMPIAQIMAQQGEAAFRAMETAALRELCEHAEHARNSPDRVLALGGGALLRDENRRLVEIHGTVVLLTAGIQTLLDRLKDDAGKRPLLTGDMEGKLLSLLESRREHYSSFSLQLDVDSKSPYQSAAQIERLLGRFHLRAMGEYDVMVAPLDRLGYLLLERGLQNPVVLTDEHVAKLHAENATLALRSAGFDPNLIIVPPGESHKNLEAVQRLWQGFLENGLDRRSTVIALGGGVIGDLGGFAASTYMRGIRWVCVPTTLLAMVDASLGGKTGFDLPQGKNLIGSFYPPKLVLGDPHVLQTLPTVEFISGLAEVVKHGIIADPDLFNICARGLGCVHDELSQIVRRAMAVKIKIIEDDPFEREVRAALNLGHTVGHAVELVSRFQIRHGEAVAIGMVAEAALAERLSVAKKGLSDHIGDVLSGLGLPISIPAGLSREEMLRAMRVDKKKNADAIRFALPADIGRVELVEVRDLRAALV